jgi:hypothetical protein
VGQYLGLVTDGPLPEVGTRQWWLIIVGAAVWSAIVVVVARLLGVL